MVLNLNRNKLSLILIFGLISLGILKFFPITVKEELVTQTFTIGTFGEVRTTLNVREQAIVTGTYSVSLIEGGFYLSIFSFHIKITAPDRETIFYEDIYDDFGSTSGSFRFIARARAKLDNRDRLDFSDLH